MSSKQWQSHENAAMTMILKLQIQIVPEVCDAVPGHQ
jgi:hypothetical protein